MRNAAFCITGLALQGLSMSLMAQTDKPNIVIIMTDQQRADLCGREGFPLAVTPYVDQLAQENVWFNKAYTVAPASSPARCSMFTGRFPSATHVRTNHNIPDIFFEQDLVGVLKENGYKIALCSGRPLLMAKELDVFNHIEWDGFIGSAGNTVYDENLNKIKHNGFGDKELETIFSIAKKKEICLYVNGSSAFLTMDDPQAVQVLQQFHVQIPKEIRGWQKSDSVEMISMFKGYDYDYSDFLQVPQLRTQKSSGCIVDLIKEGINKTTGIHSLLKYWGMEDAKYMAFGDSLNDKEMLDSAYIGVAMENGDVNLYPYADVVCGPSFEDSIYAVLKSFQMIK